MERTQFILIQADSEKNISFGANRKYTVSVDSVCQGLNIDAFSLPVTFKKLLFEIPVKEQDRELLDAIGRVQDDRKKIRRKIKDGIEVEATVTDVSSKVLITPDEDARDYLQYFLPQQDISDAGLKYGLEPGDRLCVKFSNLSNNIVTCSIVRIIAYSGKREKQNEIYRQLSILRKDLSTMSGYALWTPVVDSVEQVTLENGNTYEAVVIKDHELVYNHRIKTKVLPYRPVPGQHLSLWIWPVAEDTDYISFSGKTTNIKTENNSPDYIPDYTAKIGTVTSFMTNDKNLVNVCFDGNSWWNSVFRNRYNTKIRQWEPDPVINAMLPRIIKYLPLGFNAKFLTDFKVDSEKNEVKSRLKLCGFDIKIEGRTSHISELFLKKRNLKENVIASICGPCKKDPDNMFLITSDEYAGVVNAESMPSVLVDYARQWIYTPELKVPANVFMDGVGRIVFDVKHSLDDEWQRLKHCVEDVISLKVCSIRAGRIYLTTEGGYPVRYICKSEEEIDEMRGKMFTELKFKVSGITGDEVQVIPFGLIDETIDRIGLDEGSVFYVENAMVGADGNVYATYNSLKCKIFKETLVGDSLPAGKMQVMMVGRDSCGTSLLCVAHPERFNAPANPTKVQLRFELMPDLWLCSKKNRTMLMNTNPSESVILRNIKDIYGIVAIRVIPRPFSESNIKIWVQSTHVIEDFNYKNLIEGTVNLFCGISMENPRAIYGDVVLTVPKEYLDSRPIHALKYSGKVDECRNLICMPFNDGATSDKAGDDCSEEGIYGEVVSVTGTTVDFNINGTLVHMNSDSQLHIPRKFAGSLYEVFIVGSRWSVVRNGESFQLDNECPNWPVSYLLICQLRHQQRPKMQRDWIVKSENGKIGLLDGRSISDIKEGEYITLILDEGAIVDENYTYLREVDNAFKGRNVNMVFDSFNEEEKYIECHPVEHRLTGKFKVPVENWNWVAQGRTCFNCNHYSGALFNAMIVDIEDNDVTLNRKYLIEQCKLLSSSLVSGRYQMKVVGMTKNGYLLQQSDVQAVLPFDKAAWFPLNSLIMRSEYLPVGTLIEVELSNISNGTDIIPVADLKITHEEQVKKWLEKSDLYDGLPFTVCRISNNCLFVEKEGIVLPLSTAELHEWKGTNLAAKYHIGQQFFDCTTVWDSVKGLFKLEYNVEIPEKETPELGGIYDAILLRYTGKATNSCFVRFGEWTAVVGAHNLTWEPYPLGCRPYQEKTKLKVKVLSVNLDNCLIEASVIACLPRPETGPASEHAEDAPELRRLFLDKYVEVNNEIKLFDENKIPCVLTAEDSVEPLSDIVNRINLVGYIDLPIIGLHRFRLRCSQKMVVQSVSALKQELDSLGPEGSLVVDAVVQAVSNRLVQVAYGAISGKILKQEAWWQTMLSLKDLYSPKQKVRCKITEVDVKNCIFTASVIKADPEALNKLLPFSQEGDEITVKVLHYYETSGYVTVEVSKNIFGIIPECEIPSCDISSWTRRFQDDWIRVKVIGFDPNICKVTLSRKQMLAPGILE